ncbi:MAG: hypothetical protein JNJ88_16665 [Planctomycetes bacterium]|nr:hypothetical protein [Planctomycetota bacterium]
MTAVALAAALLLLLAGGAGLRSILRAPAAHALDGFPAWLVLGIAVAGSVGALATLAGVSAPTGAAAALALCAAAGIVLRVRRTAPTDPVPWSPADLWIFGGTMLAFVIIMDRAMSLPMSHGDEVTVWGYKARAAADLGRVSPRDWSLSDTRGPAYPPALPMAAAIAAVFLAGAEAEMARLLGALGFVAFAWSCAAQLRALSSAWARVMAALGIASLPIVLTEAPAFMADLTFAAALSVALRSVTERPGTAESAALASALACIKIEGTPMGGLLVVASAAMADPGARLRAFVRSSALTAALVIPWAVVAARDGALGATAGGLESPSLVLVGERLGTTAAAVAARGAQLELFGLLLPALVLLALSGSAGRPIHPGRALLLAGLAVFGQLLPLAIAPQFDWQLRAAAPRAALHLVPALLTAAGAVWALRARKSPALLDPARGAP